MAAMTSSFLGSAVVAKAQPKVAAKKAVAPVASLDGLKKVRLDFRGKKRYRATIRKKNPTLVYPEWIADVDRRGSSSQRRACDGMGADECPSCT